MVSNNPYDIFPKDWLEAEFAHVEKVIMNITDFDKAVLNMQVVRKEFENTLSFVRNNHHPFDGITYTFNTNLDSNEPKEICVNVRNNRTGEYNCVMQIIFDGKLRYCAYNEESIVIDTIDHTDNDVVTQLVGVAKRINELVGCFTLMRRSDKRAKKIGSINRITENIAKGDKSRVIRLRDISDLQLSTYFEGNGSKPSHEFGVRGHIRHYKNGREVFIKPYTKCKGRGLPVSQTYKISN